MEKLKTSPKTHHGLIIDGLSHLLADTYMLYLKTQNFHWNVTGPHFFSLHTLFEEQYKELADAIDEIAERIRALKAHSPASFSHFLKLTALDEADENLEAEDMVQILLNDNELLASHLNSLFGVTEEDNDEVTKDLFIRRKTAHDKAAWMLRSLLSLP
jgi:starvation-inducible DNA-binding protein